MTGDSFGWEFILLTFALIYVKWHLIVYIPRGYAQILWLCDDILVVLYLLHIRHFTHALSWSNYKSKRPILM